MLCWLQEPDSADMVEQQDGSGSFESAPLEQTGEKADQQPDQKDQQPAVQGEQKGDYKSDFDDAGEKNGKDEKAEQGDASTRLTFADLPSHSVSGPPGSVKHYIANASAYRILDDAFVMHSYDHAAKSIDTAHFEYIISDPSGPNRWSCSCELFALSAKNYCIHTLAATVLSKRLRASASPSQTVICCDKNKTVWAVLGGQGCFRSIVQLSGGVVRTCLLVCS
jgi:hypothetical protein